MQFDDNECVYGMVSAEGEIVQFETKVDVNEGDKKGNVEKWMLEIEKVMRDSLRKINSTALDAYFNTKRIDWVRKWPGQIVLSVNQTVWTQDVEKALSQGTLDKYEELSQQQIEDIVQLVRADLNK